MERSHDTLYLSEDNKKIKQSFVEVGDEIVTLSFNSIADVGCATGAFPNYLSKRFPKVEITGIEYLQTLLNKANADFPHINFIKGNILDKESVKKKFDIITMLGVLCIFDDYKLVLENALNWLNPKGKLILHNMISDYDIDVFVKYKPSSLKPSFNKLESGWNILSKKSLELVVNENNSRILSTRKFVLNLDLDKKDDVMRSWTEQNISGSNDIYNALHIRQPQKIVVIEKLK